MAITVYSKPACMQCTATKKALDRAGLDYTLVDISMDDEARDYVLALGYLQAPVVEATASTGPASAPSASAASLRLLPN